MKATIENQKTNEVELAHLFEVEELEERMEFGRWTYNCVDPITYETEVGCATVTATL